MNKKRIVAVALVILLPAFLTGLVLAKQSKRRVEMPRHDTRKATAALQTLCKDWAAMDNKTQGRADLRAVRELCAAPKNNPTGYLLFTCESERAIYNGRCVDGFWDAIWNPGLSYCSDLKNLCSSLGGGWSAN